MAESIQRIRGDTRLDVRRDEIQHFTGQAAGDPHEFNVFYGLYADWHFRLRSLLCLRSLEGGSFLAEWAVRTRIFLLLL